MTNKSPITFFIPGLNGGGAQKVVVNLANALVDLTNRPVHIVLARGGGEFLTEVRPEVEVINLGKGRASRSILALAGYLRRTQPAVLCSSLNYANICASIAWRLAGRPCRLVLREDNVVRRPQGVLQKKIRMYAAQQLMRWLYPGADNVIAIGDAVAQTLKDRKICAEHSIRIISNPVAVSSIQHQENVEYAGREMVRGRYICAIGRLAEQKGFDVLLNAFSRLQDHDLSLVILGEGPLRKDLEVQARQMGVAKRVHMPGFVSQPERVLTAAELFVLSSRWEGFGNVLVEALAVGTPIVSTDCPGAPREILKDGELGHLVPVEDPKALAMAIEDALGSPRGTKVTRRSRAHDFDAPVIAAQYLTKAFGLSVDRVRV